MQLKVFGIERVLNLIILDVMEGNTSVFIMDSNVTDIQIVR